jgi:hypothetical protein
MRFSNTFCSSIFIKQGGGTDLLAVSVASIFRNEARLLRKMDLADGAADPTVELPCDIKSPSALVESVGTERLLQVETPSDETTTCTLIASYNISVSNKTVCELTEQLSKTLADGEADVSAIDVGGGCTSTALKPCTRPKSSQSTRSLQSSNSSLAPGYLVFTVVADELNCTQIAANLTKMKGLHNVSVDVKGTTGFSDVSDNASLNLQTSHPYILVEILN